jgi:hypothetical protein
VATNWAGKKYHIKLFDLNFYIAFLSMFINFGYCLAYDEFTFLNLEMFQTNPDLIKWLFLSSFSGIALTVGTVLLSLTCQPVTMCVAGIVKDVGQTWAGFFFFPDVQVTKELLQGLSLSFTGAVVYLFH